MAVARSEKAEPEAVLLIEALEKGLSERKAAKAVGVSRCSVRRVKANPRRRDLGEDEKEGRCTGCGARVKFPCRACRLRSQLGIE
jgi:hypothetical protein